MLGPADCLQRRHDESGEFSNYFVQGGMVVIEIALFNEGLPLLGFLQVAGELVS